MRATKIVTCFITNENKILLLKRSDEVKSMKGLWAGVSGIIEKDEPPLARAKREIFEEVGLHEGQIKLLKSEKEMRIVSPQYKNHEWLVFPFLFGAENQTIKLNWENSDYRWISIDEIKNFETVPSLDKVLLNLL
ncbi:MAG: NUDIX domain-containing protein [Thermoproteota archaeon]|jgi:8-oxo-dGTP pyrophosphatase MutT (NUDIX family)|nr:NUDIX domain-containing protein [Nitrosopumilaceae archaeon]